MTFLKKRIQSIYHALNGLKLAFVNETHIKLHTASAIAVIVLALICEISKADWLLIILAIVVVFLTELFNTAIEKVCDFIELKQDPQIKYIKDISAAAVFIAAIFALVVAVIVFWPFVCAAFTE